MGKHKKEGSHKDCGFVVYAAVSIVLFFILTTGISYIQLINSISSTLLSHVLISLIAMSLCCYAGIKVVLHHKHIPKDVRTFSVLWAWAITIIFLWIILRDILLFPFDDIAIIWQQSTILGHTVNILLPVWHGIIAYVVAMITIIKVR